MGVGKRWALSTCLLAASAIHAVGCGDGGQGDDADSGVKMATGSLTGPTQGCVGEKVTFRLEYPPGAGVSPAIRYEVWTVSEELGTPITADITIDPGRGETIRVECLAEGDFKVEARGPDGDYLSSALQCVSCADGGI